MLCAECGKRQATLHFTKIINGVKTETHLCEVCAKNKGEAFPVFEKGFSFHQLLSGLLNFDTPLTEHSDTLPVPPLQCPTCGLTYSQFSKLGRFSCGDCYKVFKEQLKPLLRRIHGHSTHRGKIPARAKGELKLKRELQELKEQLFIKIQAEEFEEAARLRDKIRDMQEKLKG